MSDAIAIRLADEGVPVAAIARALQRSSADLWPVLREALAKGALVGLPPADWPPRQPREAREGSARRASEADQLVMPLQRAFRLSPAQARMLAALYTRREITRETLHRVVAAGQEPTSDIKIVAAQVCHLRERLQPHGVAIETVWGSGYALPERSAAAIAAALAGRVAA